MLVGFIWFKVFLAILPLVTGIEESVLVALILSVAGMSFRVHCLAKSSSALSLKFEMNLLLWNSGGIKVIVQKRFQNLPINLPVF